MGRTSSSPKKMQQDETLLGDEVSVVVKSKRSSPRKGPAVIKLKMPEPELKKPLKLTLKLSKSSSEEGEVEKKPAESTTRITPKLTLSLRRPSVDTTTTRIVEENVPKKRGRKPKSLSTSASVESVGSERSGPARRLPESAPVSLSGSKSSAAGSSAASLSTLKPAVPVYSEEDRLQRQIISEMVQDRVTRMQSHRAQWDEPPDSVDSLIASLWPFYEQLSIIEVTHSGLYRQAGMPKPEEPLPATERQSQEYDEVLKRFNDLIMTDKTRCRPTELIVLEHRLCLEEEKFLYTKMKNEYYSKYASHGSSSTSR